MTDMRFEEVALRAIDLRDERFRTSRESSLERLVWSIKNAGLVNPPVVARRGSRYVLVTGWKRVQACRALGIRRVSVLVTEETDELRLLLMALSENLATRDLTLAEKAIYLKKLSQGGMPQKTLVREYLPRLGLPATVVSLHLWISLAEAGRTVLDFVSEKAPSPAAVKALLRFAPADRRRILPLLRPLGQNKQKQLLEDLWDIGRRDELPVERLFRRAEPRRILRSTRLSSLQRAERIREWLRKTRYPSLIAREESLLSTLHRLQWPRSISLQPSPSFEDDSVTISFRAGSREEFRTALDRLEDLARRKELEGLFRGKG